MHSHFLQKSVFCPGRITRLVRVSSRRCRSPRFDSWSGHIQEPTSVGPQVQDSLPPSPSIFLSLKTNKQKSLSSSTSVVLFGRAACGASPPCHAAGPQPLPRFSAPPSVTPHASASPLLCSRKWLWLVLHLTLPMVSG